MTRLGEVDGPGMLGGALAAVSRLEDGRYALSDQLLAGTVRLLASDGSYVSTIGRLVQGPGEFQIPIIHFLHASGDTLFVIDVGSGRISAFSPDGDRLYDARRSEISAPSAATCVGRSLRLANAVTLTSEGVSLSLHLMGTDGSGTAFRLIWTQEIGGELP